MSILKPIIAELPFNNLPLLPPEKKHIIKNYWEYFLSIRIVKQNTLPNGWVFPELRQQNI